MIRLRIRRQFEINCCLLFCLLFCLSSVRTENENDTGRSDDTKILNLVYSVFEKCSDGDFMLCLKEKAVRFIDGIPGDYEIMEGLKLQRTSDAAAVSAAATTTTADTQASHSRSLPSLESIDKLPATEREQAVDNLLIERVSRFLSTYTLQFKIPDSTIGELKRSLQEEGRRKKKKYILPLLLLFKMKAAMLIPIVLGGLALLAFKALIMGKIALLISGLIALKKLVQPEHHSQTYEVVAHPHHSYSSTYDDHGHYGRSFDATSVKTDAQNIAYRSQIAEKMTQP